MSAKYDYAAARRSLERILKCATEPLSEPDRPVPAEYDGLTHRQYHDARELGHSETMLSIIAGEARALLHYRPAVDAICAYCKEPNETVDAQGLCDTCAERVEAYEAYMLSEQVRTGRG